MAQVKPKILINAADRVTFHNEYLRATVEEYFDIVDYDPEQDYSAGEYVVMTHSGFTHTWYRNLVDSGAKLIYDAFWEHHVSDQLTEQYQGSALVAAAKNYFWINEYYTNQQAQSTGYQPHRQYQHLALLPIRQLKPHRQQLLTALGNTLDQIVYSIVEQGRYLPNDIQPNEGAFDRYFNPAWYDSTYFSIVSETTTYSKYLLHITEKTFKPIAYQHPYIVFGQTGTLAYLHELGFESFENLFDESYDAVEDQQIRLRLIVDNVNNFKLEPYDQLTLNKLEHNHHLFYNASRVKSMLVTYIINPILEYVNKT